MAPLPYMPLYIADHLAATAHLCPSAFGAYTLLLMNYWQRGKPLRDDDSGLARIARMSESEWEEVKVDIREFFQAQDGVLVHKRVEKELQQVYAKSKIRSDVARTAAARRAALTLVE